MPYGDNATLISSEDMIDHRNNAHNLSSSEIKAWKTIQASTGFEPMTSAIPVQCSANWELATFANL